MKGVTGKRNFFQCENKTSASIAGQEVQVAYQGDALYSYNHKSPEDESKYYSENIVTVLNHKNV